MKPCSLVRSIFAASALSACASIADRAAIPDVTSPPDAGDDPPLAEAPDAIACRACALGPADDGKGVADAKPQPTSDASADALAGDAGFGDVSPEASSRPLFFDDFNRPSLDVPQHGWRLPTLDQAHPDAGSYYYAIDGSWLRIAGDTQAPGSSALLALTPMRNGTGTFEQRRTTPLTQDHYTDLVFRYDTARTDGLFYRVRLHEYVEQGGMNRGEVAELALFRIVRDDDQHGTLLNNRGYYWENPSIGPMGNPGPGTPGGAQSPDLVGYFYPPGPLEPTIDDQCAPSVGHPSGLLPPGDPGCPTAPLPDRSVLDRFRVEVTAQGNVITFKVFGYKEGTSGERQLVADRIADTAPNAIVGPGLWGVAHYMGTTHVDDFRLDTLDP
jgi:hypothetical protein